jgi:hypothetical protein
VRILQLHEAWLTGSVERPAAAEATLGSAEYILVLFPDGCVRCLTHA